MASDGALRLEANGRGIGGTTKSHDHVLWIVGSGQHGASWIRHVYHCGSYANTQE